MSRLRRFVLLGGLLLSGLGSLAQVNPDSILRTDDDDLDMVIEDAITDIESNDQTDWTIFTDQLEDYRRKPLDLNRAAPQELMLLPGMTALKVNNLLSYIQQFGNLTSIYELQAVEGFDLELFLAIRPYVQVREAREKDISTGDLHPAGPPLREVLSESRHELLLRWTSLLEQQRGFSPPDTASDGSLSNRYAGNAQRYYARYRMRYNRNFSMALVGEKDPGEEFKWDPQNNFHGFDFTAGHISIGDYGNLKRLVIGDYNIQVGQGILLSTGLGFGKGSQAVNAVKRQSLGIRPYASVNENQFMRGAAATVAFSRIHVTGFFSRVAKDANITIADTLDNDNVLDVSTLQTSGFHRTASEIEDKDALLETNYGARVEYKSRWLNVGATHYFQDFGSVITPNNNDYQFFNFAGDQNFLTGLDFDATFRNFNFFGEVARSKSGGTGMVLGMLTSLHPKVDLALQFRNFAPNFHTFRAFVFAERPTAARNERGVYFGLTVTPSPRWKFSTYFDQFVFPWHNFNVSFPSRGNEFFSQLEFKPSRSLQIYLRFRSDHKQINARELPAGQQIEFVVPTRRDGLRLHLAYKVHRTLTIRSRIEASWYQRGLENALEEQHTGLVAYQDIAWKLGWKWKLTGRYAIFDAQDFDARIYAYENDILGFFSIPAYAGLGTRYYLLLNYKPVKGLQFWARFARTRLRYDQTIGSGLNEITGNTRSEVKLQMQLTF
ncbi:MAG: helix-hairpin-helix domain-containing protein [Bacteroidota bacterium]